MSSFLEREHPDITYLKNDGIGLILSKGLSETFKSQPRNPIEYFAKYLLNHSKTQKKVQAEKEREKVVKDLKDRHVYFIKQKQLEQEEIMKTDRESQNKIAKFYEVLEKSEDLTDNLDELANFLQQYTGATGVYIGKLEKPRKDIGDDDDDKAHVDRENPKVIKFITASNDHEFMKGKLLKVNQGISHEVFKEPPVPEVAAEEGAEEGGQERQQVVSDDILQTFRHVYVKEVVREPKMHFYKVPRLGSYMSVPLEYFSCLSENALDNAVQDYLGTQKAREDQEKSKLEWEDEVNKIREEKEKIGENWDPEGKEWDAIDEKPFETKKKSFVVCFDTMGQDREFTDTEKRFALDTIRNFKNIWERTEIENLTRDRNRKLEFMEIDKEFLDNHAQKLFEEEEAWLEEALKQSDEPIDEEQKDVYLKQARLNFIARLFRDRDEWKRNLFKLKDFKVMKVTRVLQSIFYLLRYKREQICQRGTNKFFWKIAKNQINDEFIQRMLEFRAFGPKDDYYERYTTINFIERNIEGIIAEDVDHYNLTLGKLFKWLLVALRTRKEDITLRKVKKKKAREEREHRILKEQERLAKKEVDVVEAESKFKEDHREEIEAFLRYEEENAKPQEYGEEDDGGDDKAKEVKEKPVMPVFNVEEYLQRWLEENPVIEIPSPIIDDKDNDWYMNQEEEDALIAHYYASKGESQS